MNDLQQIVCEEEIKDEDNNFSLNVKFSRNDLKNIVHSLKKIGVSIQKRQEIIDELKPNF